MCSFLANTSLSLRKKREHLWIFAQTLVCQLSSVTMWTPEYLYVLTCLMSCPCMSTEQWSPVDLGSSRMCSAICALMCKWFSLLQSRDLSTPAVIYHMPPCFTHCESFFCVLFFVFFSPFYTYTLLYSSSIHDQKAYKSKITYNFVKGNLILNSSIYKRILTCISKL